MACPSTNIPYLGVMKINRVFLAHSYYILIPPAFNTRVKKKIFEEIIYFAEYDQYGQGLAHKNPSYNYVAFLFLHSDIYQRGLKFHTIF